MQCEQRVQTKRLFERIRGSNLRLPEVEYKIAEEPRTQPHERGYYLVFVYDGVFAVVGNTNRTAVSAITISTSKPQFSNRLSLQRYPIQFMIATIRAISLKVCRSRRSCCVATSVPLGPTRSYSVLLGPTRSYSVLLGPTRSYSVLLGPTRSHSVLLGPTPRYAMLTLLHSLPYPPFPSSLPPFLTIPHNNFFLSTSALYNCILLSFHFRRLTHHVFSCFVHSHFPFFSYLLSIILLYTLNPPPTPCPSFHSFTRSQFTTAFVLPFLAILLTSAPPLTQR